jgi:hypothetical protein
MIKLDTLHQQLLTTAASLDAQLCEIVELRQRIKKALLARRYLKNKPGSLVVRSRRPGKR